MRITRVEYRRLRSFGTYENETVGVAAEVGADETPEAALGQAREWVAAQLAAAEDVDGIEELLTDLKAKKSRLEADVRNGERKYERLRDLLARHGVELPAITAGWYERDDDIPF